MLIYRVFPNNLVQYGHPFILLNLSRKPHLCMCFLPKRRYPTKLMQQCSSGLFPSLDVVTQNAQVSKTTYSRATIGTCSKCSSFALCVPNMKHTQTPSLPYGLPLKKNSLLRFGPEGIPISMKDLRLGAFLQSFQIRNT